MIQSDLEVKKLWNVLVAEISSQAIELPTNPIQKNRKPKWFKVTYDSDILYITNAQEHKNSCSISTPRKISFEEFKKVYPYYVRRKAGHSISAEVMHITVNQVYHFGLMKYAESQVGRR